MRGVFTLSLLPLLAAAAPIEERKYIPGVASAFNAQEIPDSYIVVFKEHVDHKAASKHHDWVQDIHLQQQSIQAELKKKRSWTSMNDIYEGLRHTYHIPDSFLGYSGHFHDDVIREIAQHPDVAFVEMDQEVWTQSSSSNITTEKDAPWGLARISHREGLSFGNFNKYLYSDDAGEGVDVYVIDTGTNIEHVDFEGRAAWGKTIPKGDADVDGNGHGTHCSGTVAGRKFGVAKKASVKAVKVLRSNGSGSMSDVIAGVEWAAGAHLKEVSAAKKGKRKGFKGSAANMSLGGGKSAALDQIVNAAVDAGIHFAVAAGNDNADSCKYSPAAAEKAVTVGASTLADERAYFSNYGKCNDIFAPGLNIQSTWIGSKYAVNIISGTSMASPHVAGLLAYLLSLQPARDSAFAVAEITPKKLKESLLSIATSGALSDVPKNTENILAWNGGGKSNYSAIVEDGGYKVSRAASLPDIVLQEVEDVEDEMLQWIKDNVDVPSQPYPVDAPRQPYPVDEPYQSYPVVDEPYQSYPVDVEDGYYYITDSSYEGVERQLDDTPITEKLHRLEDRLEILEQEYRHSNEEPKRVVFTA